MTDKRSLRKPRPFLTVFTVVFGILALFLVIDEGLGLALNADVQALPADQLVWRIVPTALAVILFAGCLVLRRKR